MKKFCLSQILLNLFNNLYYGKLFFGSSQDIKNKKSNETKDENVNEKSENRLQKFDVQVASMLLLCRSKYFVTGILADI